MHMTQIPDTWIAESNKYRLLYTFPEAVILSFLVYLRIGTEDKNPVIPETAFNYLSGVKFMMTNLGVKTLEIDNSKIIKGVKTGMLNSWRKERGNKVMDRVTLPYVLSMILIARSQLLLTGKLIDHCTSACQIHTYTTFSRISEVLPTNRRTQQHYIRTKNIIFEVVGNDQTIEWIPANHIHKIPFQSVKGIQVIIGVDGTKNDEHGEGHAYYYPVKADYIHELHHLETYCYVRTMYDWAISAKPLPDDPFFSCTTECKPWRLTPAIFVKSIKRGAMWSGIFNVKNFTSKSLRVAAASAAAAANLPDYTIKALGRWKSAAFLKYIRASTVTFAQALQHLSSVNTLTIQNVAQMIPGFIATIV